MFQKAESMFQQYQDYLRRKIAHQKEDLEKERPFLTEAEIKRDESLIHQFETDLQKDQAAYEKDEKERMAELVNWYENHEDRWRNHYAATAKEWCIRGRRSVDRMYRVRKGLGNLDKVDGKYVHCPRCKRKFNDGWCRGKNGYMMAAYVKYYFPDNLWIVSTGFGSIISDGDIFVVKQPVKMGSLLRRGLVLCDFCLVDLVESQVLSVVFMCGEAVVDERLFQKLRYGDRKPTEYEEQRTHWI